jgi:dolichol-phosphate mannosyltransferase
MCAIGMYAPVVVQIKSAPLQEPIIRTVRLPRAPAECVVVVPTYNEGENIASLIHALQSLSEPVDILVVDDNSPDGTADIVRRLMREHDGIYLLHRSDKRGLGNAYKAGFDFALKQGWEYICQMDADFSHNPTDIPKLLTLCRKNADIAIGSRYVAGGKIIGWPWRRWLLSRVANLVAQTMLQCRINDLTGGFKCFTRNALKQINLTEVASEGYIFQVEMNHRAKKKNLRIKQCPICFTDRRLGSSKMGKAEASQGFQQLIRLCRPV